MKVFEIEPGLKSLLYVCLFVFFNWKIIALQCVGFWHIATEVSHSHIYVCMPLRLEPRGPLECHGAQGGAPRWFRSFPLVVCFTLGSAYVAMLLSQFVPPSPFPAVLTSQFSPLRLHSFPTSRCVSLAFLAPVYMHWYVMSCVSSVNLAGLYCVFAVISVKRAPA